MALHGFDVTFRETDGGHTWINWRQYLHEFVPQVFTSCRWRAHTPWREPICLTDDFPRGTDCVGLFSFLPVARQLSQGDRRARGFREANGQPNGPFSA